ncbi:Protein of unknown function, partial [Cotesia congregata]
MSNKNFHDLSKRRKRDYLNSIRTINNAPHPNNNQNEVENLPLNQRDDEIIHENENNLNDNEINVERVAQFQNAEDTRQINILTHNNIENQTQNQLTHRRVNNIGAENDSASINEEFNGVDNEHLNPENVREQREEVMIENSNVHTTERDIRVENLDKNGVEEEEEEEEEQIFDEDEDEDDNLRNNNVNYDLPLYKEAPLTISQSMLLIATLLITHNVTQSCIIDIIAIINLHCLNDSFHKNSLFRFKKFFGLGNHNFTNHKKHYYCSNCLKGLSSSNEVCPDCLNSKTAHFITLSISEQLQQLYNRPGFHQQLQHRFRQPNSECQILHNINDVYDGYLYKNLARDGYLSNRNNISFIWYTDGVPVFKSSRISIWPLYLTINELPIKEWSKRHNLILA